MERREVNEISWRDFENVQLAVGTILTAKNFPEAKRPAYQLTIDCGSFGVKKSSAQVTQFYSAEYLVGKQVVCVMNFPPKQIGNFISDVLVTGFITDEGVVLAIPERSVKNGLLLR